MLQCLKGNKETKNEKETYPPHRLKAFTLSEVLITLVIIGIIAAITVPNIIQSSQNKEFHSKLKKNMAVLDEALRLAQIEEGMTGDNTAIFTPSDSNDRSYESAVRLAKYLNTLKVCKNRSDSGCYDKYYSIKKAVKEHGDGYYITYDPKIILTDGTIYTVQQYADCESQVPACKQDQYGNCLKDEDGNDIMGVVWNKKVCAYLHIDVNGEKGPNKYGSDNFLININRDKILINTTGWTGGKKGNNIMLNKD